MLTYIVVVFAALALACCSQFFVYQEQQAGAAADGSRVETSPLLLGIQTEWQRQQAWELGHGNAVLFDTTFGTNKYGVSVCGGRLVVGQGAPRALIASSGVVASFMDADLASAVAAAPPRPSVLHDVVWALHTPRCG